MLGGVVSLGSVGCGFALLQIELYCITASEGLIEDYSSVRG